MRHTCKNDWVINVCMRSLILPIVIACVTWARDIASQGTKVMKYPLLGRNCLM